MDSKQIYSLVDELVSIDAQIKALEKTKDKLKEQIVALGEGSHPGHLGYVSVALQARKSLTPDKVKKLLTPEQFESCYTSGASIVVRVTQFNKEERLAE